MLPLLIPLIGAAVGGMIGAKSGNAGKGAVLGGLAGLGGAALLGTAGAGTAGAAGAGTAGAAGAGEIALPAAAGSGGAAATAPALSGATAAEVGGMALPATTPTYMANIPAAASSKGVGAFLNSPMGQSMMMSLSSGLGGGLLGSKKPQAGMAPAVSVGSKPAVQIPNIYPQSNARFRSMLGRR